MEREAEIQVLELHELYNNVVNLQMKLPRSPSKSGKYYQTENEITEMASELSDKARAFLLKYSGYGSKSKLILNFLKQVDSILTGSTVLRNNPYKKF